MRRSTESGHPSAHVEEGQALDPHRTATILTLLVLLWGAISLLTVPWEPFWIPNLAQTVVCAVALVYFLATWNRPRRRVAEAFSMLLILYSLLLLPWTAVEWCRLGRPLEAFTVPQLAIVSMAVVFPGPWPLGVATMSLFAAESVFAYVYARHVGLESLLPINEPLSTVGHVILGLGLFTLRRRRKYLARQHVRLRAEIDALDRVRPQFARASTELEAQLTVVTNAIRSSSAAAATPFSSSIGRALARLGDLRRQLRDLAVDEQPATTPKDAEERLLARDAQLGALLFAATCWAIAVAAAVWSYARIGPPLTSLYIASAVVDLAIVLDLVRTRTRPSSRRALWAVLAIFATTLPLVNYVQFRLVETQSPYGAFLGLKALMCILGLTLTTRFKLGATLIVFTAANAIALWFILDLGAHRDRVPLAEPWTTVIYAIVALASLRMLEQSKIASIQLLRDEAGASAMHRRAQMFLALRDRLNSPLQTLVLAATGATSHLPESNSAPVQEAIDKLVALSRELASVDIPRLPSSTTVDADKALRRHL